MNLVNTMMNSIYTRRRELGMIQAIGMSEKTVDPYAATGRNHLYFGNIGSFCGHWKSCRIWCISLCKNQTHVSDQ